MRQYTLPEPVVPVPSGRDRLSIALDFIDTHRDDIEANLEAFRVRKNLRDRSRKYGVAGAEVERMMKEQGGLCYICGEKPGSRGLNVDHCHTTGRVRKLLCTRCNAGLGFLEDGELMAKLEKYLAEHSSK